MKAARAVKTAASWGAVVLWLGGIWWLSDQPDLRSGLAADFLLRKLAHVAEFAVLAALLVHALRLSLSLPLSLALAVTGALLYAGIDEWHQSWVPGRHGSLVDAVIDAVGIASTGFTWHRYQIGAPGAPDKPN